VTQRTSVLFAITGGLAAASGLLMTSRLGSGNSNIGYGVEWRSSRL
jgi:sugar transport system permease protein